MPSAATHKSRKRQRRCQREAPPLPLDLVLEIAARSDPTSLVRCAATCKDARRRIADPGFHGSLRLRHADCCFVPSLLRGHLVWNSPRNLYLVDNATKNATKLQLGAAGRRRTKVLEARGGLLLILTIGRDGKEHKLHVFSPITSRSQIVPHQRYEGQYVFLVGDDYRRFRVVKVKSVSWNGNGLILQSQIFSSDNGRWGRSVKVPIPYVHGGWFRLQPLVTGSALHWLCRSDKLYYIVKLHVDSAQVTITELPVSFHQEYGSAAAERKQLLLATTPAAGSRRLCVYAADGHKISVWAQSERDPSRWTRQPRMEIFKRDVVTRFGWDDRAAWERMRTVRLEWFSDRSGSVLFDMPSQGLFMLD